MTKKSKTVSDAEKMLEQEIKAKQERLAAPVMSDKVVGIFQEIIEKCGVEMDNQYADFFLKIGGAAMVEKKTGKASSLLNHEPDDLIKMGLDFRVVPTVMDSVTQRPIKGKAILFVVEKEMDINIALPIMKIQERMLLAATKKYPKDQYIKVALITVQENIKIENEIN